MNETGVTGWRYWQVLTQGYLGGLHTPHARQPWYPDGIEAVCNQDRDTHAPDQAPWPDCECGIRIMPRLDDLLDGIEDHPARTGITRRVWRVIGGAGYYQDRLMHGVLDVPDVIGQAIGWGRTEDACPWDDPPGTVRVQHARVGPVIYLSQHLARMAPAIRRRYPGTRVHVGHERGLPWLDEIHASQQAVAEPSS
ncbi:hypothetical protein ACIQVR_21630 [Streptomyces xanthochromogenes]|uniref:hypothetical protein n=1 Tax=Streptomyces xanthochromogenes TaxID=67384 RepID=UPI0038229776